VNAPRRRARPYAVTSAACLALVAGLSLVRAAQGDLSSLGPAETVVPGVELYRLSDPSLLSPPGPVAVQLLRLDPGRIGLDLVLAQDTVVGLETVPDMAVRANAVAAINAGFFLPTGEPAGLFKIDGELLSDISAHRGAVAIVAGGFARRPRLLLDQVSARIEIDVQRAGGTPAPPGPGGTPAPPGPGGKPAPPNPGGKPAPPDAGRKPASPRTLRVDGVDTVRGPEALVLFTPRFWTDTRTPCDGGTEIVVEGPPLLVSDRREAFCTSAIPRRGLVLAAGPKVAPERIAGLDRGAKVRPRVVYETLNGTKPSAWNDAPDIVGGVGLLAVGGRMLSAWEPEQARAGFATERHPRTVIGTATDGRIWLVTVDGRNKDRSLGMSFVELQGLIRRVGLANALNLDGGGSTTMVVKGVVVNHPSDATGPRRVSDAIVVR
jgi:hypothetical protein